MRWDTYEETGSQQLRTLCLDDKKNEAEFELLPSSLQCGKIAEPIVAVVLVSQCSKYSVLGINQNLSCHEWMDPMLSSSKSTCIMQHKKFVFLPCLHCHVCLSAYTQVTRVWSAHVLTNLAHIPLQVVVAVQALVMMKLKKPLKSTHSCIGPPVFPLSSNFLPIHGLPRKITNWTRHLHGSLVHVLATDLSG